MPACRPKEAAKAIRKRFQCKESASALLTLKVLLQLLLSVLSISFNSYNFQIFDAEEYHDLENNNVV